MWGEGAGRGPGRSLQMSVAMPGLNNVVAIGDRKIERHYGNVIPVPSMASVEQDPVSIRPSSSSLPDSRAKSPWGYIPPLPRSRSRTIMIITIIITTTPDPGSLTRQRRQNLLLRRGMESHELRRTHSIAVQQWRPDSRQTGLSEQGKLACDRSHRV